MEKRSQLSSMATQKCIFLAFSILAVPCRMPFLAHFQFSTWIGSKLISILAVFFFFFNQYLELHRPKRSMSIVKTQRGVFAKSGFRASNSGRISRSGGTESGMRNFSCGFCDATQVVDIRNLTWPCVVHLNQKTARPLATSLSIRLTSRPNISVIVKNGSLGRELLHWTLIKSGDAYTTDISFGYNTEC